MKQTGIIAAAILAAVTSTPSIACTDWKAIAAFDAVIAAHAYDGVEASMKKAMADKLYKELEDDRVAALADKCQENAQ